MAPLPPSTCRWNGTPVSPSTFILDLEYSDPSIHPSRLLDLARHELVELKEILHGLDHDANVAQIAFSRARHLHEDGSLHWAPESVKEAELKREVRPCGHAIGSGEHYCGTSERVEGEESERHGSETSIENGSGSGTTSSSGTSSSSPATEDKKTSDITPTARDIHPPQGPRAFVRKDNDVDSEAIGLKRSCPNAPASMRAEKRVKLGIDGYVPDGPKSARTLADVFSRKEREARERAEQARKEEREKERRKREDKMLGEDVRRKEDAWKAARGKVAGCEWDIVVIKADIAYLLNQLRNPKAPAHTRSTASTNLSSITAPPSKTPSPEQSKPRPCRLPTGLAALSSSRSRSKNPPTTLPVLNRVEMENAIVEWEPDEQFEALQARLRETHPRKIKSAKVKSESERERIGKGGKEKEKGRGSRGEGSKEHRPSRGVGERGKGGEVRIKKEEGEVMRCVSRDADTGVQRRVSKDASAEVKREGSKDPRLMARKDQERKKDLELEKTKKSIEVTRDPRLVDKDKKVKMENKSESSDPRLADRKEKSEGIKVEESEKEEGEI